MRDYTYKAYAQLIDALLKAGYNFLTFEEHCENPKSHDKWCIMRHDVDRLPWNAVEMAKIERDKGVKASYFFRVAKEAYNQQVIRDIVNLGHEAGYHYEDMDLTSGDVDAAYKSYLKNLAHFREFYPVRTICMHGSPMSKFDNRSVWEKYDYKKEGIIGEPYFDLDYSEVFYITDTGRHWNNAEISVRDKVISPFSIDLPHIKTIMELALQGNLPKKIMINTHPHRWFDNFFPWTKELIMQNIKNEVKRILIKRREG